MSDEVLWFTVRNGAIRFGIAIWTGITVGLVTLCICLFIKCKSQCFSDNRVIRIFMLFKHNVAITYKSSIVAKHTFHITLLCMITHHHQNDLNQLIFTWCFAVWIILLTWITITLLTLEHSCFLLIKSYPSSYTWN